MDQFRELLDEKEEEMTDTTTYQLFSCSAASDSRYSALSEKERKALFAEKVFCFLLFFIIIFIIFYCFLLFFCFVFVLLSLFLQVIIVIPFYSLFSLFLFSLFLSNNQLKTIKEAAEKRRKERHDLKVKKFIEMLEEEEEEGEEKIDVRSSWSKVKLRFREDSRFFFSFLFSFLFSFFSSSFLSLFSFVFSLFNCFSPLFLSPQIPSNQLINRKRKNLPSIPQKTLRKRRRREKEEKI